MLKIVKPESNTIDPAEALSAMDVLWPWTGVPYPSEFQVLRDEWVVHNAGTPEESIDYEQGPLAIVRMPNDAYVKLEQIDPFDRRSYSQEWRGNWDEYTKGVIDLRTSWGGIFAVVLMLVTPKYEGKCNGE